MNDIHPLTDTEWNELIAYIGEHVHDVTLKRGFQYYKQNRIRSITMPDSDSIVAAIKGQETYHITVQLRNISRSRCTCPMQRRCKHLIAALLWYAERQGRSTHQIINAKILWELKGKKSTSTASTASLTSSRNSPNPANLVNPANPASRANSLHRPNSAAARPAAQAIEANIPTMSVSEWHALWDTCVTPFAHVIRHEAYLKSNVAAMNAMKPPLPSALESIYRLNAYVYIVGKITQGGSPLDYGASYKVRLALEDAFGLIHSLLGEGIVLKESDERAWLRTQETLEAIRQLIRLHPQHEALVQLYHQVWQGWIRPNMSDSRPFVNELDALNTMIQADHGRTKPFVMLHFKAMMLFYLARDEEAWGTLRELSGTTFLTTSHLTTFFDPLYEAKDWARLTAWLVATGPLLRKYNTNFQSQYLDYWSGMLRHSPEAEPLLFETLAAMLPFSQSYYQEVLLTYERWEQWIDYQLATGSEPLEFRATMLAPIEKNAPAALLPYYHQAVERYVQQKNRTSYKSAVKLLKRLFRIYKKMKQEECWIRYIESFTARYSRLRALQEELQKGKLL